MVDNASEPTGGLLLYADTEDGYSTNSDVVFVLLTNETAGGRLSVMFGDGHRQLVNQTTLTQVVTLPTWIDPHLRTAFPYQTTVRHVYRRPGTYDARLLVTGIRGNTLELTRTTIQIHYETMDLKDLEVTSCVDDDGVGTILITSRHPLCDVVAEWSYDNQLFIDFVSFSDDLMPAWASVNNQTLYSATLMCCYAVTDSQKHFVVSLTGRVFNTTYKFAETRPVDVQPVSVELVVTAQRVAGRRAAVLRIESVDRLDNLHVTAGDVFSDDVELNPRTANDSTIYEVEITLTMTLPVPDRIDVTVSGTKGGVCFIVRNTTDVADLSDTGSTDFEVFAHVDDVGNAAVVLLAGRRVRNVRVSWGSDNTSFVRTVVDLTPDEWQPVWLRTAVSGYYTATVTHRFVGSVPNISTLTIVEHADDSTALVKPVRINRRQPSDGESPSSAVSRPGMAASNCDARPSYGGSFAVMNSATEPISRNVYVTTHRDADGTVTLQFYSQQPVYNMIVDWDMPGKALRQMVDVVQPATNADGYYTTTVRHSFDSGPPNVTRVRMTGRVEGSTFDISAELDHSRRPPNAGLIAVVPVHPAPPDSSVDGRVGFHVTVHNVTSSNMTFLTVVTSKDESLKEVLLTDLTCSVRTADSGPRSVVDQVNDCIVAFDPLSDSLSVSLGSGNFTPGQYNIYIQVLFSQQVL